MKLFTYFPLHAIFKQKVAVNIYLTKNQGLTMGHCKFSTF